MNNNSAVIKTIVNNNLCIGCGVCIHACENDALEMQWDKYGFMVASIKNNNCTEDGNCIKVCPFNPNPENKLENEEEIAKIFLNDAKSKNKKIGNFTEIYAGYSKKYRPTSSSGGISTYIFEELLSSGIVNHVIAVTSSNEKGVHYQYAIISKSSEIRNLSKTRYYPVSLDRALKLIENLEGKVAISGVGCFIKAIRLAQSQNPILKEKIAFLVGIICGGVKSSFFTEYLSEKTGTNHKNTKNPEYRIKDSKSTAVDYSFECTDIHSNKVSTVKMQSIGDMWGSGLFKANACDFCDDVTTELADISLGDAWIEPYSKDGLGNNVVVTRSALAQKIITQGIESLDLQLSPLKLDLFISSQQGSFNHRHDGLYYRIQESYKNGIKIPKKRYGYKKLPIHLMLVQKYRRAVRKNSLDSWEKFRAISPFEKEIKRSITALSLATKFAHAVRKIKNIFEKIT